MSRSGQCVSEYRYCCIWSCLSSVQSKIFGKGLSTFCSRFLNNEILTISATQRFLCSINRNLANNMLMLTINFWTMRSCINVLVMPKPLCVCVCIFLPWRVFPSAKCFEAYLRGTDQQSCVLIINIWHPKRWYKLI